MLGSVLCYESEIWAMKKEGKEKCQKYKTRYTSRKRISNRTKYLDYGGMLESDNLWEYERCESECGKNDLK